ncbi:MAG: glycosyltransferase family 4 protein [Nitrososphaerota archaeon]|nr:glycosyltransferase family 4 protein [Nitrososphaerota archaeon]
MKILVYNWRCWCNPEMGGAEIFTHEVAMRWVKAGHEVTLFTAAFPRCIREEIIDGIKIIRSGGRFSVFSAAKKFYLNRFRGEHFDLIIDEINTRPFFAHTFAKNDEVVVALIHQLAREYWFYETRFPLNHIGHYLEDRWLQKYVTIPTVTVSDSTYRDLAALGLKRLFIIPEGVNFEPLSQVSPKSSQPVIVYCGRLKKAKRPSHALRAFEKVKAEFPEAELWIIGDGPIRRDLEKVFCRGVRFYGSLGNVERRKLIEQSWVLVNPGVREGWGLNVIEANALGVPTVAYAAPGLRDSVQDNVTGFLVESGDIEAMADKIMALLRDGELRERFSRNALEYSRNFSWDVTARELLDVVMASAKSNE